MQLKKFKELVNSKKVPDDLVIFLCKENHFVAMQYTKEIARQKGLNIVFTDIPIENDQSNNLYVNIVDKLEKLNSSTKSLNNNIIICNEINDDDLQIYATPIPKLESWQTRDYIKALTKLDDDSCEWLNKSTNSDIYRIDNEINKLRDFANQQDLFNDMRKDGSYNDSSSVVLYDLSNAILKKDFNSLAKIYGKIDVQPFALIGLLIKQFKMVISIQLDSSSTANSLNISDRQFNAIRYYSCGYYNKKQLVEIYDFLTSVDYKIKSGQIEERYVNDYIITYIGGI